MSSQRALLEVSVLIALAAVSAAPLLGRAGAPPYTVLQDSPDRLIVELPNRLLVIAQELHTVPVVSAQVWVKTGSIYEQEHVGAGLSHLLEHLLSAGTTETRTEEENTKLLGMMGAETNAGTSLDSVSYYINTTSQHAAQAIDLLSDWMQHGKIEPAELAREKDVVLREFEMGEGDPGRILWKLTQGVRYQAHPARHPTIGYVDEFKKIERDEVYDFYRRMYVPNNLVFVVVGDIERRAVVDQIAKSWSESAPRDLPKLSFPIEPAPTSPREARGVASIQRPRLRLAWPSTRVNTPGDYELDLLAGVLGGGEASRLVRGVRDRDQAVTDIDAYNSSFSWGEGFFGVDADVTDDVGKAKERILAEVRRLLDDGVGKDELATAKRQVIAAVAMSGQSAEGLASVLANNVIDYGDPDYHRRYAEKIQSITADAVVEAGRRYLDPQRLMTIVLEPAAEGVPIEMRKRDLEAATAAELPSEPVDLDNRAIAASIRSRARSGEARTIETAPIETFVLPNGLRVLVGRSTLVPGVAVHLYHLGGLLADPPGRLGLTNAASELRMRGTERRSADELAGEIESLGATITTGCGNNSTFTQASGLAEDLPRIVELVADVTLHPSFPAKEWEGLEQRLLAAIDARSDHWTSEISTLFRESWYDGTPWVTNSLGRREVVEKATVEELRRVHFDRLGASTAVLAVFGDVDAQRVRELATKHFGDLPATAKEPFTVPAFEPAHREDRHQGVEQAAGGGADRARSHARRATSPTSPSSRSWPSCWAPSPTAGCRWSCAAAARAWSTRYRRSSSRGWRRGTSACSGTPTSISSKPRSVAPWRCSIARARRRLRPRRSSGRRRRSWPPSSSTSSR